jgi:hypothetical protein
LAMEGLLIEVDAIAVIAAWFYKFE